MNESMINNKIEEIKQLKELLLKKVEELSEVYDERVFKAFLAYHIENFSSDIKSTIEKNTYELIKLIEEFDLAHKLKEYSELLNSSENVCGKINELFNFLEGITFFVPDDKNSSGKIEQLKVELSDYGINETWLIRHKLADLVASQNDTATDFEYKETSTGILIKKYLGTSASVVIPDFIGGIPVTKIANKVFCGMINIHFLTLPQYLEEIGEYAFQKTSIESLSIPQGVKTIGAGAFMDCKQLQSIDLSKNLSIIRAYLFEGCSQLRNIDIPRRVASIGDWAFKGCWNLKNVRIPDTCVRMGYSIFPASKRIIVYCNEGTRAYGLVSKEYNLRYAKYEQYDELNI